jgi:hypothetical protein
LRLFPDSPYAKSHSNGTACTSAGR